MTKFRAIGRWSTGWLEEPRRDCHFVGRKKRNGLRSTSKLGKEYQKKVDIVANKPYAEDMQVKDMKMIDTPTCFVCGRQGKILVTPEQYDKYWNNREQLIQHVLPELDKAYREQIISGTHPACWDELMGGLDDEDDEPQAASPFMAMPDFSGIFNDD